MVCLGVHIALTEEQCAKFLELESDDARIEYSTKEVEEEWNGALFLQTGRSSFELMTNDVLSQGSNF